MADVSSARGIWIVPGFRAADFYANGSMTWTVEAGDVASWAYTRVGNLVVASFCLNTTSVGGTVNTELRIALPAGLTITRQAVNVVRLTDNGTTAAGYAVAWPGNSYIGISTLDGSSFSAATNTTTVLGQISFEVY